MALIRGRPARSGLAEDELQFDRDSGERRYRDGCAEIGLVDLRVRALLRRPVADEPPAAKIHQPHFRDFVSQRGDSPVTV